MRETECTQQPCRLWGLPSPVRWAPCPAPPPPPGPRASFLAQGAVEGPTSRALAAGAPCRAPFRFWPNLCLALTQWGFCPLRPSGCHFVPPHCASSLFQRGLGPQPEDSLGGGRTPHLDSCPSLLRGKQEYQDSLSFPGQLCSLCPFPLSVTSAEGERAAQGATCG